MMGDKDVPVSWPSFCNYWIKHFPKMVIQRPSKDICDDCVIWANRRKYLKKQRIDNEEATQAAGNDGPSAAEEATDESLMLDQETIALDAAKHVTMAQKQRELFNIKKEQAKRDRDLKKPQEQRVYTCVCDFAQNMNTPNFNAEQPGATCHHSPLNVFPFGVVDCSNSELTAHVCSEGEAKKGGNSVASMIWKQLDMDDLRNGKCAKEINLVFDNCTGQNKNRMIIRLLIILVKVSVTTTARAIFLVKGHTKNDCDRMFNLSKAWHRRVNVHTPSELVALMNTRDDVRAVKMLTSEFKNWNKLQDTLMKTADDILKNHVFTVRARDSNWIMMQEYDGAPINRQELVKPAFRSCDWKPLIKLELPRAPGLPDIKWNELCSKWGKFVPEENKKGLIYYTKKPPPSLLKRLAEQKKQSRAHRAK